MVTTSETFVYFARRPSDGAVKIGISANPAARVKSFGKGAELLAFARGCRGCEFRLHHRFDAYALGGEWFAPHGDVLCLAAAVAERGAEALRGFGARERGDAMMMHSMPGFLCAMSEARTRRPDLTANAWRAAANTTRREFSRLRVTPSMVTRWAEFYAFQVADGDWKPAYQRAAIERARAARRVTWDRTQTRRLGFVDGGGI